MVVSTPKAQDPSVGIPVYTNKDGRKLDPLSPADPVDRGYFSATQAAADLDED